MHGETHSIQSLFMIMQPQKMATGKKADRQGGKGKRDSNSYNALLVVFLFSVLVMVFSMLTLPSDDLDVSANMKKLYIESRSFIRKKKEKKFKSNENLPNSEDDEYHIVFSTACSPFQNWQAYVFQVKE